MVLSEQEAHCVARLLQASLYGGDDKNFGCPLDGCQYCKVQCYKQDETLPMFRHLKAKFSKETGVDVGIGIYGTLPNSKFPYKKFLKNTNAEVIEHFRNFFSDREPAE